MMRLAAVAALLGVLLARPAVAAAGVALPPGCATAEAGAEAPGSLPRAGAALRKGGALSVLAVGSSRSFTTPPSTASAGGAGIPWQMVKALESAVPGLRVSVTAQGGHGATAQDMLGLLRRELGAHRYALVLWQTGTVEAVRNLPPDELVDTLLSGIDAAHARGADVVLVDQQYSRFLEANADVEPYRRAIEQVAAVPGVALLRRFEIMRGWVADGRLDLERARPGARRALLDRIHVCLGRLLAQEILTDARP